MWKCSKCGKRVEVKFDACWNCGTGKDGRQNPSFVREQAPSSTAVSHRAGKKGAIPGPLKRGVQLQRDRQLIVTTTPSVEGKRIQKYCGLVSGEAILGANVIKDFFAGITDILGGRSAAYEGELRMARDIALKELKEAAVDLGANAVVGVDLDYETIGNTGSMLMVAISGTAVILE